jgi:folate-dependent tRNA-U54 methylase TrmFO/GidA
MNINLGLMDPTPMKLGKRKKRAFVAERALKDIQNWRKVIDSLYAEI